MHKFSKKTGLLLGLMTGAQTYAGPFYATIDITRRCNLRCEGCRYHSRSVNMPSPGDQDVQDISSDLFEKMCSQLRGMGTRTLIIMGEGEPFLHPRLFDFISFAKGLGFHVTLLTNGTLLTEKNIHSLIDSRLDVLKVSLWACSADEFKRNIPGSTEKDFQGIIDGLKLLTRVKRQRASAHPTLEAYHPINSNNFRNVETFVDMALDCGANRISFSPFRTRRSELRSLALSEDQQKSLNVSLKAIKKRLSSLGVTSNIDAALLRYKLGESVWKKLPCYIGWFHLRMKVDGTVLLCDSCDVVVGNLKKEEVSDIWNNAAIRSFRRDTLTRARLESMVNKHCDCGYCCYVVDNNRLHRIFRWFAPFRIEHKEPVHG